MEAHSESPAKRPNPANVIASLEAGLTVAAAVGLVYVIGGAVMWLRFRQAHLPADQAVALLPKTDLLVAGLRVMILPAAASAAFLVVLADWQNARLDRLEEEQERIRTQLEKLAEESAERAPLEARLQQLAERERRLLPGTPSRRRRLLLVFAYALALVFALVLPFSPGAFVWPIVILAIVLYWRRLWSTSREEGRERPKPSLIRIAAVAMIASAVVSVARQLDPTAQLPSVDVYLSPVESDLPVRELPATLAPARRGGLIRGILIMASEDSVAVGNPKERAIGTYPRSRVIAMSVGRPLVPRTPPASLMSLLLFEDAWALTPLKLWCGGDDYDWTRVGDACQGRPVVERGSLRADGRVLRDLRITCPHEAQSSCRGFVKVQTAQNRLAGAKLALAVLAQIRFTLPAGRSIELSLPFDPAWGRTFLGKRRTAEVAVRVLLARDALGEEIVFDDRERGYRRMLSIRAEPDDGKATKQSKKKAKKKEKKKQRKPSNVGGSSGGGSSGGGSSGGGSSGGGSSGGGSTGGGSSGGGSSGTGEPESAPIPSPTPEADALVPPPAADEEITEPPEPTPTP